MKNGLFKKARWKLTAYYVLIMMVILAIFSSLLVYIVDLNLKDNLKGNIIIGENKEDLIQHTKEDIEVFIYYIDGLLIVIISLFSYFLASKTLKPIKKTLDIQKQFSADASHDLRTPIAIIISESEVALNDKNDSGLRSVVQSNLEEAKKMSKLVNDLLLISRGENKNDNNNFVMINLHYFVSKIVSKMKVMASDKGLSLVTNEYKKILLKVDISNFERAISNIVQNSIYYTKNGGVVVNITDDEKNAYIEVTDTGVGIEEKDLPYIFKRFYKATHSKNDESGSGLGLPISKQIIDQHKGKIYMESKVNVGTRILITIPKS